MKDAKKDNYLSVKCEGNAIEQLARIKAMRNAIGL